MQHEAKITRPNGQKIRVYVSGQIDVFCVASYANGREAKPTPEEVYKAKLELWERLKPTENAPR